MEDSKMPQDPSKGKKAAPPPKGSNKPMAARQPRPTELTAKTQDYVPDKYTPPKKDTFSFTRQQTGEKTVKSPGNGPNLSSNTSRRMQFEGGLAAEYVGAARANAARVKKETPNSLVSAEYRAQLTKDLAAGKSRRASIRSTCISGTSTRTLASAGRIFTLCCSKPSAGKTSALAPSVFVSNNTVAILRFPIPVKCATILL